MLAQFIGIVFGLAIAGAVFINGAIDGVQVLLPHMARQDIQGLISGMSQSAIFNCRLV